MEAKINYSPEETERIEVRNFINEGLQDVKDNKLIYFDELFSELETRYHADE